MKKLLLLFISINTLFSYAQLPMGGWTTHLAYNKVEQITQAKDKVYAISDGALFTIDKMSNGIEINSKINGLSDNNIINIGYSEADEALVIVYSNSNIDIMADGEIINISDIMNKTTTVDKTINDIFFNNGYAYLSTNLGIIVVSLAREEIVDTYVIGENGTNVPVYSLLLYNDSWIAITESNLYTAPSTGANLANYNNWRVMSSAPSGKNKKGVVSGDKSYLLKSDGALWSFNGSWTMERNGSVVDINSEGAYMSVHTASSAAVYKANETQPMLSLNVQGTMSGLVDMNTQTFWFAYLEKGVGRSTFSGELNNIKPNGPLVNTAWNMKYRDGKLIVVQGGRWATQEGKEGLVMIYENSTWSHISSNDIYAAEVDLNNQGKLTSGTPLYPLDFCSVEIDPTDPTHFFVAAYGLGLYEFRNNKYYIRHNSRNSGVETIFATGDASAIDNYCRMDGLQYGPDNNLWMLNMSGGTVTSFVKYMTPDGVINGMKYAESQAVATASSIIVDNKNPNRKWACINRGTKHLFVFDDNGTLEDLRDDEKRLFTAFTDQDENLLTIGFTYTMAQDLDGNVWLGTDKGPLVIDNPNAIFDSNFRVTKIKIPRNDGTNFADYLLEDVEISTIIVDGANRKWIGTKGYGLYLISSNGQETIQHFTAENSPILSNDIISLCLNEKTGELFIGTSNGLCSYRTDSSEGEGDFSNLHAFPNPVRPEYHGVVTLIGLMEESIVKITDLQGNLVYETRSNGGVATWSGKRANGNRVATGIYLAICTSKDGTKSATTKILFIN